MSFFPDLRHVRYVALAAHPPDRANEAPKLTTALRGVAIGAMAGSAIGRAGGHLLAGLLTGSLLGLGALIGKKLHEPDARAYVIVPWGLLVEGEHQVTAVRWSGVRSLDVRYAATRDGSVYARVSVDCVLGTFVGYASDAVDLGALAGDIEVVATASTRRLAIDLEGDAGPGDGDPFVDRLLDAAKRVIAREGESRLGLERDGYRARVGVNPAQAGRVARTLRELATREGAADMGGLVAAVAGELRLAAFAPELSRLSNTPHPAVAAVARAALARIGDSAGAPTEHVADTDHGEALSWFLPPDELERLRIWRDAPAT